QTIIALLFILGNCFDLVQSIPTLLSANAAADRLARLELDLSESLRTTEARDVAPLERFRSVGLHNVVFRYFDRFSDLTFQIGPLDFVLRSGDLVFITGGNGSGKSTFLKVLAGLYPPDSGDFVLDGRMRIDDSTRENY